MSNPMELFNERMALRTDLLAGKQPKRVPVYTLFTLEAACGFAGVDLLKAHYDTNLMEQAFAKVCDTFYSDAYPLMNLRFPSVYQFLGAKNWVLGSSGVMQHPEIETMAVEDYDDLIAAPYETIVERLLPRVCTNLNAGPTQSMLVMAKAMSEFKRINNEQNAFIGAHHAKYGYSPGLITNALIEAPFDFLADQLRGFTAISMDARRVPDKVEAAAKAVMPLMLKIGTPVTPRPGPINFIPLHLGPYINPKQFARLYWPSFEEMVVELDRRGVACTLYAEEDWTRDVEYLTRLPKSTKLMVENGDAKRFKETVGKDHVMGGFYEPMITLTKSKEACIDEAKRLLDIGMPGGHFYFGFGRQVMDIKSVDVSKLQAVLEWVRDNAHY